MTGRNFEQALPESIMPHSEDQACSSVENWPDDEFARWVVSHRAEVKTLVCGSRSYGETIACRS
jgi:hypothetical protein